MPGAVPPQGWSAEGSLPTRSFILPLCAALADPGGLLGVPIGKTHLWVGTVDLDHANPVVIRHHTLERFPLLRQPRITGVEHAFGEVCEQLRIRVQDYAGSIELSHHMTQCTNRGPEFRPVDPEASLPEGLHADCLYEAPVVREDRESDTRPSKWRWPYRSIREHT